MNDRQLIEIAALFVVAGLVVLMFVLPGWWFIAAGGLAAALCIGALVGDERRV